MYSVMHSLSIDDAVVDLSPENEKNGTSRERLSFVLSTREASLRGMPPWVPPSHEPSDLLKRCVRGARISHLTVHFPKPGARNSAADRLGHRARIGHGRLPDAPWAPFSSRSDLVPLLQRMQWRERSGEEKRPNEERGERSCNPRCACCRLTRNRKPEATARCPARDCSNLARLRSWILLLRAA